MLSGMALFMMLQHEVDECEIFPHWRVYSSQLGDNYICISTRWWISLLVSGAGRYYWFDELGIVLGVNIIAVRCLHWKCITTLKLGQVFMRFPFFMYCFCIKLFHWNLQFQATHHTVMTLKLLPHVPLRLFVDFVRHFDNVSCSLLYF